MSNKDLSKDVLNVVKNRTGKSVSSKDVHKLASNVKPSTLQSDAQLRQLIMQVGGLVGAEVPESTVNDIIQAVKSSQLSTDNLEQLMNMMTGKK